MRTRWLRLVVTLAIASLALAACQSSAPAPASKAEAPKPAAEAPKPAAAPTAAPTAAPKAAEAPKAPAPTAAAGAQPASKNVPLPTVAGAKWPSKPVGIDNAGNAGGGLDLFGRSVAEALTKEGIFPGTFVHDSHGGGGGNTGMAWLLEQKGNTHILMANTNRTYLNPLVGTTKLTPDDFTPVARVATDYMVIAVRKDSPYKTLKELVDALKKDPKAVSFANGTAPPSSDYLNVIYTAVAAGIDPTKLNIVVFNAGGEVNSELLGGHVQAASSSSGELLPFYDSGDMRFLSVSSPERLPRLKDVPTLKEQGYNVVLKHWRGLFAPKDLPKEVLNYWTQALGVMVTTPTWKGILEKNNWADEFLAGEPFSQALKDEAKAAEAALRPLGLLPPGK